MVLIFTVLCVSRTIHLPAESDPITREAGPMALCGVGPCPVHLALCPLP